MSAIAEEVAESNRAAVHGVGDVALKNQGKKPCSKSKPAEIEIQPAPVPRVVKGGRLCSGAVRACPNEPVSSETWRPRVAAWGDGLLWRPSL